MRHVSADAIPAETLVHTFFMLRQSHRRRTNMVGTCEKCVSEKKKHKKFECAIEYVRTEKPSAGGGEISSKLIHHQNILIWVK